MLNFCNNSRFRTFVGIKLINCFPHLFWFIFAFIKGVCKILGLSSFYQFVKLICSLAKASWNCFDPVFTAFLFKKSLQGIKFLSSLVIHGAYSLLTFLVIGGACLSAAVRNMSPFIPHFVWVVS